MIEVPDRERSTLALGLERAVIRSGLSKMEFSRRCRISPSTLNLWIKGVSVPTEANLARVARLLDTEQGALRDGFPLSDDAVA